MKILAALAAATLLALVTVATALAMPNTANTILVSPPPGTTDGVLPATSGYTLYVQFTVFGTTPVVPYEYALQNTCIFPPSKSGGHFTLGQHDDIVYWTDHDFDGNPQVTMPVYLQSVPSGSSCKVFLVKKNTVVKGSTFLYAVAP